MQTNSKISFKFEFSPYPPLTKQLVALLRSLMDAPILDGQWNGHVNVVHNDDVLAAVQRLQLSGRLALLKLLLSPAVQVIDAGYDQAERCHRYEQGAVFKSLLNGIQAKGA